MSQYLITLSIGPVQDFIIAARRTRDLWMGSYLLSEISKAAAKALVEPQGELIFPATDNSSKDLTPCQELDSCFNVGNKILGLIEADSLNDLKITVNKAKKSAQIRWEEIAKEAKARVLKVKGISIDSTIWDLQINDVLEIYSSWIKYDPQEEYKTQRERLDKLLNARKNTRDFLQNKVDGEGVHKSSLDGLRENLIDTKNANEWELRKLGLNRNESLDITGVAKRIAKKPEQFTPLSRLAIDTWLRGIKEQVDLTIIRDKLEKLCDYGLCTNVSVDTFYQLPFDGQLLYSFRIDAETNKIKNTSKEPDKNKVIELLKELKEEVIKLQKEFGEPLPYMAILHADGDNMGKLLDAMDSLDKHKNISAKLSEFSQQVPTIVRDYFGHCVYAGGDDVLALLPLDQAIACGKELADKFYTIMEAVTPEDIKTPTLSVGLGISHFMTPMSKQLNLARKAEKLAKEGNKNALAIILSPRSGAEITFKESWKNDADKVLCKWIEAHIEEEIPRQAGYNLRDESMALDWINKPKNYQDLIDAETQRILSKKRKKNNNGEYQSLDDEWIDIVSERAKQNGLRKTADELIMTYRISQAYKQAGRKAQEDASNV